MNLTLRIRTLSEYKGTTKFDFWKSIRPHEILRIDLKLKSFYRSRNGISMPYAEVTKEDSGESEGFGWNEMCRYLNKIDHEEF